MDAVIPSIWISSLTGALLFYASGRLRARAAYAAAPHPEPVTPQPLVEPDAELEAERARARRAEEATAGALRAHEEAVRALAAERSRGAGLRDDLARERDARAHEKTQAARDRQALADEAAKLRAHATQLAQELAGLRARPAPDAGDAGQRRALAAEARVAAAERRIAELASELEAARREALAARGERDAARADAEKGRAELARIRVELAKAQAEHQKAAASVQRLTAEAAKGEARASAAEALATDAARLRKENARLEEAVVAFERERAGMPDLAGAQKKSVEAAVQLKLLEQRAEEIARREAENVELRRRVEALAAAAAEADELRRRVKDLEAQGFARRPLDSIGELDEVPDSQGMLQLETGLELGLREFVKRDDGCRAAVLADERGLLIAAYGEASHRVELAAAASLTTTVSDRLRELLPMGAAASLTLVDANALAFRTRWLRWDDECFLLCTLGAAEPEDEAPLAALRVRVSEVIGAT